MRGTRHNGRSGKDGVYNPKHNDRNFDIGNSDHIDPGRIDNNIYWDCYQGYYREEDKRERKILSFSEIEKQYYSEHYGDFISGQNERNIKARHPDRCRTLEDLLEDKRIVPEETIYQLGTIDESESAETLLEIFEDFQKELKDRFGDHIHTIDWALHTEEGTPHIHERHVFDVTNRYGELQPKQDAALEELGFELPDPEKKRSRNNNRKMSFDMTARALFFEVCERHKVHLIEEPAYGGREYLEKQDYIRMKQKDEIARQDQEINKKSQEITDQKKQINENALELFGQKIERRDNEIELMDQKKEISRKEVQLEELTLKIEDVDQLLDVISVQVYDKALERITDQVIAETKKEDIALVKGSIRWVNSPERKASQKERNYAVSRLENVVKKIENSLQTTLDKLKNWFAIPETRTAIVSEVKKEVRPSILAKLNEKKERIASEQKTGEKQFESNLETDTDR